MIRDLLNTDIAYHKVQDFELPSKIKERRAGWFDRS